MDLHQIYKASSLYTSAGTYSVSLTVTGPGGESTE